ncbi:MAG TPA: hypothetical protein VEC99_10840 [Clostridia bacterium]|nr:hypothetical protein [Clostridia bacterium]
MQLLIILGLMLVLPLGTCGGAPEDLAATSAGLGTLALPEGWLQVPSREVVLDLRHESLEFGGRQDAGEFLAAVLNVLLGANYTVYLSDGFIRDEINYYRSHLSRERPAELSATVLKCLEQVHASGQLDWDSFQRDLGQAVDSATVGRHLPWLSPPFKANALRVAGAGSTNLPCLHLSLKWASRDYGGGVQYSRRPGGLTGETVLREGQCTLWAFDAELRLFKGDQRLLQKAYFRDEWQRTYVTVYERPLWKTSQAVLTDLATGVKVRPVAPEEGRTKPQGKGGRSYKVIPLKK